MRRPERAFLVPPGAQGSPAGGRWAQGHGCWGLRLAGSPGLGLGGGATAGGAVVAGQRASGLEQRTGSPPPPSKLLCCGVADGFFWHSRSQAQWVALRVQGPVQSCRSRPLSGEPWKAGRTAECLQVLVMAGALCRGSARPQACLKHHLLRLGGQVPVCECGRGTAASRPGCWWWPQLGGPRGGRGCVHGHGWPPTHRSCLPGPAHQTIAPPVVFRAGLSCLQIFGSRPQKIPSVSSGSGLLPWVARVTRAGLGGTGLPVLCPCRPPTPRCSCCSRSLCGSPGPAPASSRACSRRLLLVGGCGFPGLS